MRTEPRPWSRRTRGVRDGNCSENEYSLMQYNFSLFFGIAVQLYEATLVSDDTPWDRFRRQHPTATDPALNPGRTLTQTISAGWRYSARTLQRSHAGSDEHPLFELS